jgi:hypothetical protein
MLRKQLLIAAGMFMAIAVCIGWGMFGGWGTPYPAPETSGDRLAFAWRWMLIPGFTLFLGVGFAAASRFFLPDAIDGERRVENKAFEINLRYNLNTTEQLALAAVAWSGLALVLPPESLGLIPRLAILFGIGRVAFWLGYLFAPWARGFGMGLTSYPQFAALIYLAFAAF